jgi:hypothetical protein
MKARFTDDEKTLLEQAFQLRESQTEEQRATIRAEFGSEVACAGRFRKTFSAKLGNLARRM